MKFEHSTLMYKDPDIIWFKFLNDLSEEERTAFFDVEDSGKVVEIGSTAFHKIIVGDSKQIYRNHWEVVQEGRYEYCVNNDWGYRSVRIILSNYLACYIAWQE